MFTGVPKIGHRAPGVLTHRDTHRERSRVALDPIANPYFQLFTSSAKCSVSLMYLIEFPFKVLLNSPSPNYPLAI